MALCLRATFTPVPIKDPEGPDSQGDTRAAALIGGHSQ